MQTAGCADPGRQTRSRVEAGRKRTASKIACEKPHIMTSWAVCQTGPKALWPEAPQECWSQRRLKEMGVSMHTRSRVNSLLLGF